MAVVCGGGGEAGVCGVAGETGLRKRGVKKKARCLCLTDLFPETKRFFLSLRPRVQQTTDRVD